MRRDLGRLAQRHFNVVVVGGGIYGACVAWEAVLRGCSVALLEQGDFGHATSSNSHKIVHGGFRYLQHADLARMRQSIAERKHLMRIAPHLVHPQPFLLPTYRAGIQRQGLLRAALRFYDLFACDRNWDLRDPQKRIPPGRLVSRQECLRMAPGLEDRGLTGGAIWHDGLIYNTERLTLAFVRSAVEEGAVAANYVRVRDLIEQPGGVAGVRAIDILTGRSFDVRARVVINTSGPWVDRLLLTTRSKGAQPLVRLTKGISVVSRALTSGGCGLSVLVPHRGSRNGHHDGCCRRYHIVPWRGRSMSGSLYRFALDAEDRWARPDDVERLLDDLNRAYPGAGLRPDDVCLLHAGVLPAAEAGGRHDPSNVEGHARIVDHGRRDGLAGLLSVVGVKYTMARAIAEQTIDLALRKLGRDASPSRSATRPVAGGAIDDFDALLREALHAQPHGLDEDVIRQLILSYGSAYRDVLRYVEESRAWAERVVPSASILKAQVIYAVREELAQTLSDVVCRRTELASAGHPGLRCLATCAELMAAELGWDAGRMAREVSETQAFLHQAGAHAVEPAVEVAR